MNSPSLPWLGQLLKRCRPLSVLCLLGGIALVSAGPGVATNTVSNLALGETQEGEISAAEVQTWQIQLPGSAAVLLRVEQLGVDLTVAIRDPQGTPLLAIDSPVDRLGEEVALLEAMEAGLYRIEIRARELGAPPGRYSLHAESLSGDDRRLPAWRQMTRAAAGYRVGGAEGMQAGVAAYRRAQQLFAATMARRPAAEAAYRAAVLLRLVDDTAAAVDLASRALAMWLALGEEARMAANAWNEIGLDRWALGEVPAARSAFQSALEIYRQQGERYGEGAALANLCLMDLVAGDLRAGLHCYQQALPILAEVGAVELEAAAQISAGRAWQVLGELDPARRSYRRALAMMAAAGNRRGEAQVLNNLGVLQQSAGQLEAALGAFDRSLEIFRQLGERRWQARVLNNLGFAYQELGEPRRGLVFLQQALAGWRQVQDRRGEIQTLSNLSRARLDLGEPVPAIELLRQALVEARALDDPRAEGIALYELARATAEVEGQLSRRPLELFDAALLKLAAAAERRTEAAALLERGELRLALAEPAASAADIERALGIARDIGDGAAEARGLYLAARLDRARGHPEGARQRLETSIEIIEGLRTRISHPQLRAIFASVQPRAYELLVDLTMAEHRAAPSVGHHQTAFEISERGRARGLAELLAEARADLGLGVDPALQKRRRTLLEKLNARAERALQGRSVLDDGIAASAEQSELLRQLDLIEAEMRQRRPAFSDLTRPEPLTVAEAQAQLVDQDGATRIDQPGPLLLVYSLGEQRSFLWALTSESFASFELPPRRVLEEAVRQLYPRLSTLSPAQRPAEIRAAAKLSRQLLGPVADLLADRQLVIVPDGALHYLPWAALPRPGGSADAPLPALVESQPLVLLPAARLLVSLRRDRKPRTAAAKRIAVLADPVFDAADPRLARVLDKPAVATIAEPSTAVQRDGLARLPWTAAEAQAIVELVPADQLWVGLGLAANRQQVLAGLLSDYAVVHLATHGILDTENPVLSGLVLSLVDSQGQPQRGFLQLADIYQLRLAADLVVLSGCKTALGKEIHGEGLVGLTRGFLYAGASRVVASLWRVEDRATAELMSRFYRALWRQGLDPASALRAAQISIRAERRWRDPYFWAGWVLIGDWR